jgi:HAMP domain-containing protein
MDKQIIFKKARKKMLNRKKRQMPFGFGNQPMMPQGMQPMMPMEQAPWMGEEMLPNYEIERLQTEINEQKRQISELLKRVVRLENYLGIRGEVAAEFDRML